MLEAGLVWINVIISYFVVYLYELVFHSYFVWSVSAETLKIQLTIRKFSFTFKWF